MRLILLMRLNNRMRTSRRCFHNLLSRKVRARSRAKLGNTGQSLRMPSAPFPSSLPISLAGPAFKSDSISFVLNRSSSSPSSSNPPGSFKKLKLFLLNSKIAKKSAHIHKQHKSNQFTCPLDKTRLILI